jgi:tRNA A-37 threonylcarbamoyl transferase component Bud32
MMSCYCVYLYIFLFILWSNVSKGYSRNYFVNNNSRILKIKRLFTQTKPNTVQHNSNNRFDNTNMNKLYSFDFNCTKRGSGCLHNGVCDSKTGLCTCVKPWEGNNCVTCGCKNGGACKGENSCTCPENYDPKSWCSLCIEGHGGPNCNACDCGGNHGACNPSPSSKAMCQCYFPYIGEHCAQCGCFNGGICTNSSGKSVFYGCICQGNFDAESSCLDCVSGYYKVTGTNPRHNDKCLECPGGKDNPCSRNGICTSDGTCKCLDGWDGPFCGSRKTEAFIIPENIVIFVSIGIGALFVGLVAMSFLVLSKNIDYTAINGSDENQHDSTNTSTSTGFSSNDININNMDENITRALLNKSNDKVSSSNNFNLRQNNDMIDYGTINLNDYLDDGVEEARGNRDEVEHKYDSNNNKENNNGIVSTVHGWEIGLESLKLSTPIAVGSSSNVYFGDYAGFPVAVKVLPYRKDNNANDSKSNKSTNVKDNYRREASILSKLHHINVVRFYGIAFTPTSVLLVQEFCHHTLQQVISNGNKKFDEYWWWGTLLRISIEISNAMTFLHDKSIVHRDLKPDNILLDENGVVKICDFGVARMVGNNDSANMTGQVGTPVYMAPELLLQTSAREHANPQKFDVYSYGILLWALWSRRVPYRRHFMENSLNTFQLAQEIVNGLRPTLDASALPTFETIEIKCNIPKLPYSLENVMTTCWAHEPTLRPTMNEISFLISSIKKEEL